MELESIKSVDTQDMWEYLKGFPDQWEEAIELTEGLDLSVNNKSIKNICFVGMGGSAIGADLIRAYSYQTCPYPVQVVRHYKIPGWVGKNTLVIACSFSGNTEETLTAHHAALEKGAKSIAVTSGGDLILRAQEEGFDYIQIPGGMPPRAALGYSFVPLYRIFQHLGIIKENDDELWETHQLLIRQNALLSDFEDNEALSLAKDLDGTLPIIYSDATMMEPVNLRWRGQFEENAKTLAYGNVLPEMNHNEIVGWEQIIHLMGRLSVIILSDHEDDHRVKHRVEIVEELIQGQTSSLHVLKTRGKSRLARMFSLVQLADWTSFYLAMLNKVDPTPIAKIDLLKRKLAER
jgi:glucose/mannose-6-phosphate isomerase